MASPDPYETLGIPRTATQDDIKRAFRALAKQHHPDLHPGDTAAEARFKAANAAQELLSDPEKRGRFDRGEIDAEGQAVPERSFYRDYAQTAGGSRYQPGGAGVDGGFGERFGGGVGADDMGDVFGAFFREQANRPRRGRDRSYRLDVRFVDAVLGATERLTLPEGQTLDVRIPPGLVDGQVLRLRGKGEPGGRGGADGDAMIEVSVGAHPLWRREGADIEMDLPVTFSEAVLGARVSAPTPLGRVTLTVPPRSDSGTRLRLRGRGVAAHGGAAAGDLYVVLRLVVGPVDAALEAFLTEWAPKHGETDRRAGLEDGA